MINYKFKIIEIYKGYKLEVMRNFGKYGATGLWSIILEEIKKAGEKEC